LLQQEYDSFKEQVSKHQQDLADQLQALSHEKVSMVFFSDHFALGY
jgi:hypothetical protein